MGRFRRARKIAIGGEIMELTGRIGSDEAYLVNSFEGLASIGGNFNGTGWVFLLGAAVFCRKYFSFQDWYLSGEGRRDILKREDFEGW
mmetsp:Transcript_8993/g.23568  ORF Transcript_8993/g.23568 Transcript_8993/m.23568 type:complete len:88 (+) Transcript_8993:536-799(+)